MRVKIDVNYPDNFPLDNDYTIIEVSDNISDVELNNICFDYAVDMLFDAGISWDFKKVE